MNFDVSNKESDRNGIVTTKQSISGLIVTQYNRKHLTGPMTVFLRSYGEQTKSMQYWVPCMFILRVPTAGRKVCDTHRQHEHCCEGVEQLAPGTSWKFFGPPPPHPRFFFSSECLMSTETVGLLGTGSQDGHLDFHMALDLCFCLFFVFSTQNPYIYIYSYTPVKAIHQKSASGAEQEYLLLKAIVKHNIERGHQMDGSLLQC